MRTYRLAGAVLLGGTLVLGACQSAILQANDPDIITSATSATGAIALKNGVISRFNTWTAGQQGPDAIFIFSGMLADEWRLGDTFEQRITTDKRNVNVTNSFLAGPFRNMQRTRVEGRAAITALRQFAPTPASNIAQMFALTAFAENQIGEMFCNGIPFSDVSLTDGSISFGNPVTVDSAFKRAINDADSALANNGGTEATRMANLASLVKARALMNRGTANFAAATALVAGIPTSYIYTVTYSDPSGNNQQWALGQSAGRYVVGDLEGGNGLNFITAADPRVPTTFIRATPFDSSIPLAWIATTLWAKNDPVVVASGIEARLIEAEAALFAGNTGLWLQKLNDARATKAGLANLADPGTADARVNLMFRERAFWLFSTGHRLGDLRRLIRQYGRAAESVFPTGSYITGGVYGADVNFPISFDELNNPNIPQTPQTQQQSTCIDRNP